MMMMLMMMLRMIKENGAKVPMWGLPVPVRRRWRWRQNDDHHDADVDGTLISLDVKKAFDSVDHRFIRKCLESFGLGILFFRPTFEQM